MKNALLLSELSKFDKSLSVSIKAHIQYGVIEKGYGRGDFQGFSFSQDYKTEWNDGYLEINQYDGITLEDVMDVLSSKTLSEISNEDFNLRLGELSTGYSEYETKWDNEAPQVVPEDSELYMLMDIAESEYEWFGAKIIELDVWITEDESVSFSLTDDQDDDGEPAINSNGSDENDEFDIDLDAILKEMGYGTDDTSKKANKAEKKIAKTVKSDRKVSTKELSMNGKKKIETLQKQFTLKFPYLTLIFLDKDRRAIDVSKTLSEIRQSKGDDISIIASLKVNTLEKRFLENYGLVVEVAYQKSNKVVYTKDTVDKSLNELNKWCENNDCQPFEFTKALAGNTLSSVQEQLFEAIKEYYPEAEAKKINKDNYLDIHVPEINTKRGTHLFFNTAKDGIKIGFYCRDEAFVDEVMSRSTNIERYAQGIRILDNPLQSDVQEATLNALVFIEEIIGEEAEDTSYHEDEDYEYDNNDEQVELELYDLSDETIIKRVIEKIKTTKSLPHLPYINEALRNMGYEIEKHPAFYYMSNVFVSDIEPTAFLYVNMDGFYSDCIEEKFQCIFSWESINDIVVVEETDDSITIDLVSDEGELTLCEPFSKSLLVLLEIYRSVWKDITKKFANQPMISWTEVESSGVNLVSFETHNDYLDWIGK
jgi:hypothetical protein